MNDVVIIVYILLFVIVSIIILAYNGAQYKIGTVYAPNFKISDRDFTKVNLLKKLDILNRGTILEIAEITLVN